MNKLKNLSTRQHNRRHRRRLNSIDTIPDRFMSISWFSERIKEQYPAITIQPNVWDMKELKIFIPSYGKYVDGDPQASHDNSMVGIEEAMGILTDDFICSDNVCWDTIIHMRDAIKHLIKENQTITIP